VSAGALPAPPPGGEEAAPPGVRAAALVRWALIAALAAAAAAGWSTWAARGGPATAHAAAFQCPMHPKVVQDHRGACPICGMDLVAAAAAPDPAPARAPSELPGLAAVQIGPERTQLIGMRTAPVTRRRLAQRFRTGGVVAADAARRTVLSARFSGFVEGRRVAQTGERVERGQVLATVYSPELVTAQQAYINAARWAARQGGAPAGATAGSVDTDGSASPRATSPTSRGPVGRSSPSRSARRSPGTSPARASRPAPSSSRGRSSSSSAIPPRPG
jgi:HlyD family secretion protein/heavy metal-binding protein